ncbi:MAG: DNA polymerase III subunit beta [Rhodospirillales bacterium]|nr:DNA polymerase III subunit beta [Rhodospirillales bacterium]
MKLTIERSVLLKALAHVQSVVERRNTIPILSNVLMDAQGSGLALTATDMDLTVVERIKAEVATSSAVTASAHTLYDIVRKLPEGADVTLSGSHEQQLLLTAGRSRFTLATLPREDFPAATQGEFACRFLLQTDALKSLIDRTRFAISMEETRYYLNGIYLHATKVEGVPMMRAVATDGHRLARFEIPLPEGGEEMPGVIVPRKAVNEVRKLLDEVEGSVEVALSDTRIRITVEETVLTSKLIDGTFPDYERVIPSGNDRVMQAHAKAFIACVDRVSTISSEKSRAVKLALNEGQLKLSAEAPDSGTALEEFEIVYGGEAMEIGFNSRYLMEVASQVSGEVLSMALADSASPAVIQDAQDPAALYVLMPMRV